MNFVPDKRQAFENIILTANTFAQRETSFDSNMHQPSNDIFRHSPLQSVKVHTFLILQDVMILSLEETII